ncbi:hypothetical protein [Flavobacterium sp. RSP15]|uniref:hypothetical protein n=1 Tax=Flavobacterium sp. RSP15 TaxID=2497485 RepID=UPI000F816745|nr:hypothetical protein [Flavobacterium sp. RSP15]RTY85508.1 hypothetical protein EKM00_14190 [Flavobacterium sp. RSP15]
MKIGVKKFIQPHNKLSEFIVEFLNKILPNYPMEILTDDELLFRFEKKLPHCKIFIRLNLEREYKLPDNLFDGGTAIVKIYCQVSLNYKHESFSYSVKPNNITSDFFLTHLNSNSLYREFHYYSQLTSNWNILFSDYNLLINKNKDWLYDTIVSPHKLHFKEDKFTIVPAIILNKLNKSIYYAGYDRYKFCFIICYKEFDLITKNKIDDDFHRLKISKLKLTYRDTKSEIKILHNDFKYNVEEDEFMYIYEDEEISKIINQETNINISLQFKIEKEKFISEIETVDLENIRILYDIYDDLKKTVSKNIENK